MKYLENNIIKFEKIIKIFLITITILILASSLQGIFATNITIDSNNAIGIQGGIDATRDNGVLTLQPGTYNKKRDTNIIISKNLTIQGNGSTGTVIIDAQKKSIIFRISSNANVILTNITFQNGRNVAYGGAIHNTGKLTIITCLFTDNSVVSSGDGYYILHGSGGAIYNDKGIVSVHDSTFTENTATKGGAIYNYKGIVSVHDSTFTENTAKNDGGAIYNNNGNMNVSNSNFTANTAKNDGGAIYNQDGNMNVSNSNFTANTASDYGGGAIYNQDGNMNVSNSNFTINTAKNDGGGAIYNYYGNMNVSNSNFTANTAKNDGGGAIYNYYGSVVVAGSNFTENIAKNDGGAIYNSGSMNVSNSNFTENIARDYGGAIYNSGSMNVYSSNFTENIANDYGAIYNNGVMSVSDDCIVIPNKATKKGNIHYNEKMVAWLIDSKSIMNAVSYGGVIYNDYGSSFSVMDYYLTKCNIKWCK